MACQVCGSSTRTTTSGYTQCTSCGFKEQSGYTPEEYRREMICPSTGSQHSWRMTTSGYQQCTKCGYKR